MARELEPYENLANAIILSAVKDYRKVLKRLSLNPNSKGAAADAASLERFFFSGWFEILTDLNPEYLVRRLKEEAGLHDG